ncbi:MAG: hypothetical protein M3Y72_02020 [Acidobacteriota bacterium]|nr:hypothetical protein [Acidobacteriota bacterium]
MKNIILASILFSCAAFGATSDPSNTKLTANVSNIMAHDTWLAKSQNSHVRVAFIPPIPDPKTPQCPN